MERLWSMLVLILKLIYVIAQDKEIDCTVADSCGKCILQGPDCSWCLDKKYYWRGQPADRCDTWKNHKENKCKDIANPKSNPVIDGDLPLENNTKVTPQEITVNIRPGQPTDFTVTVKTPKNYPVDIYYVMDLSTSMRKDKQKIVELADIIAREMKNVTSRLRLGFGAYVDKPVSPYVDPIPSIMKKYKTFNFKHAQELSEDIEKFKTSIKAINISGNVDQPEAALDAIMQAATCDKLIDWQKKEDALRMMLIVTDAGYHFAGDGLLGGIVTPNDGKCHVENGIYTADLTMDYPSLGHVRDVIIESKLVPIFAVVREAVQIYKDVVEFFGPESRARAERKEADSSNIVGLIKDAYLNIAKTQTISASPPEGVTVTFTSICPDGSITKNQGFCTNVEFGSEVQFNVSVSVDECLEGNISFPLKTPFGDVDVKLALICDCQCEKKTEQVVDSPDCGGNGTLKCGECICEPGWGGQRCDCPEEKLKDDTLCLRGKNESTACNGRGDCECGECICKKKTNIKGERIYGKFCECSNMDCTLDNEGNMCGGHGECDCGVCKCTGNWTGEDCTCTTSTETCIKDGVMCNNYGTCECGKCACNATSKFRGKFCEDCPSCEGRCKELERCVLCRVFSAGPLSGGECEATCGEITVIQVDDVYPDMGERCQFKDKEDCLITFAYKESPDGKLEMHVKKMKACPDDGTPLIIILAVVGGILGVGLALLLIWKLLATIQDRREFAKFEKERQNAKWDTGENPIFKQATTTFQNPTYGGK